MLSDGPLLDECTLHRLADDIGSEAVIEAVRLFLAGAPDMINRLEQACANRGSALPREVHSLAGAAGSVGLLRVGHAASDIERMVTRTEPDGETLHDLLELLRRSVDRLSRWEATQHDAANSLLSVSFAR